MTGRRIGWIGTLCLVVACSAEGAGPKKNIGPSATGPDLDAGKDGSTPNSGGDDAGDTQGDGDGDGDGDVDSQDAGNQGGNQDSGTASDASAQTDAQVPYEAFCSGKGPVIKVPTGKPDDITGGTGNVCTGIIARKVFKNALCACEDAYFAGYLQTAFFETVEDGTRIWESGGSVGVNGSYYSGSFTQVGGDLRIYGDAEVENDWDINLDPSLVGGWVDVWGNLEVADRMDIAGLLTVWEDATVNDLNITGACQIYGTLTHPANEWAGVLGCFKKVDPKPVDLDPPCACGANDVLDVNAIVQDAKLHNDNANPAVNLDPTALSDIEATVGAKRIELPCGRFYVDSILGVGAVQLVITGRTALFVGGDVGTTGLFDVELKGPDAELDLFVAGNFLQTGYSPFGNPNRPEDIRVFVGGNRAILLTGYNPFSGNLYAPNSNVNVEGFLDMNGSLFAKNFHADGYVRIHYDSAILEQGDDDSCNPPPPPPPPPGEPPPPECDGKCDEACGFSETCVAGVCKRCVTNADCCAPLVCYDDGVCGARVK